MMESDFKTPQGFWDDFEGGIFAPNSKPQGDFFQTEATRVRRKETEKLLCGGESRW
jgi:hypothetical protein